MKINIKSGPVQPHPGLLSLYFLNKHKSRRDPAKGTVFRPITRTAKPAVQPEPGPSSITTPAAPLPVNDHVRDPMLLDELEGLLNHTEDIKPALPEPTPRKIQQDFIPPDVFEVEEPQKCMLRDITYPTPFSVTIQYTKGTKEFWSEPRRSNWSVTIAYQRVRTRQLK